MAQSQSVTNILKVKAKNKGSVGSIGLRKRQKDNENKFDDLAKPEIM